MPALLCEPEFACVLGLLYYGARARAARNAQDQGFKNKLRSLFAFATQ
jgi:hypothetical protein